MKVKDAQLLPGHAAMEPGALLGGETTGGARVAHTTIYRWIKDGGARQ